MSKSLTLILGSCLLAAGLFGCGAAEPMAPDQDPNQVQQQGGGRAGGPAITEAPPLEPVNR